MFDGASFLHSYLQGRFKNSTRVQVSRAAGQLLWHALEEDPTEQEAHLWGDRGQAQGSGTFQRRFVFISSVVSVGTGNIQHLLQVFSFFQNDPKVFLITLDHVWFELETTSQKTLFRPSLNLTTTSVKWWIQSSRATANTNNANFTFNIGRHLTSVSSL